MFDHRAGDAVSRLGAQSRVQAAVASQPRLIQFVEIDTVSDLSSIGLTGSSIAYPFLWRVHAIHHSPRQMDWLAGPNLRVLEIVIVRR